MTVRDVIDRYHDCVNRGDWEQWLTLFSDDVTGDEQLAGHFAGISVLQGATDSLRNGYSRFNMYPQRIVVDSDAAVVVWRCIAANSHGVPIAYPNDPDRLVIGANISRYRTARSSTCGRSMIACRSSRLSTRDSRNREGEAVMANHDYVVVGAGSAGCVVAARLCEDAGIHVAVVEAGNRQVPPAVAEDITIPANWGLVQNTPVDWGYLSVPQPGLNGRSTAEPRGKLPGGSSNLYIMMHIRGHPSDFDTWAYNGCPGWRYEDCLPYFQKLEDQEDNTSPLAGKGGPLRVASVSRRDPNPVSRAFINACIELGFARTDDFNGSQMEGAGWHHVNIKDGKRHSMATAYLYPALERQQTKATQEQTLELIDGAQATRLLFNGRRCTGVEYVRNGRTESAMATREVIVCGGAIDSPKLLLLSGIGPASRLESVGIPVLVDLPGVGENFHNHVLVPVICVAKQPIPRPHNNMSEAALFYRSTRGWPGPDMQMAFVHGNPLQVKEDPPPNIMVMLPGVVRPLSRGWVRLASADPLAKPLINPNYLAVEADHRRLTEGVRLARRIYATRAFADWVQAEMLPGSNVSDAELGDDVRARAESYHHQAGSCRMGLDALAVVDTELRVNRVEGLRVADASVMPAVPSGNCHASVVMIGERCADLIKAARARA